ncbi:MAG: hypothetical protein KJN80_01925 [Deltaproteobacteria bacterium]|nr:hypothetical protein [Deltaproteobacteria bacterium]MBT8373649.1 hypothetical protein [Deltaproteobacteria bacterium]
MGIQPKGEDLRKAVKWVSEERKLDQNANPQKLAQQASLRFNLSPADAEFLSRFVTEEE